MLVACEDCHSPCVMIRGIARCSACRHKANQAAYAERMGRPSTNKYTTPATRLQIALLHKRGLTGPQIAREVGVGTTTVERVLDMPASVVLRAEGEGRLTAGVDACDGRRFRVAPARG